VRAQGRTVGSCSFPENRVNVWDVKIEVESMIGDVPWGVGYRSEKLGLISLDDSYIGLSSIVSRLQNGRPKKPRFDFRGNIFPCSSKCPDRLLSLLFSISHSPSAHAC